MARIAIIGGGSIGEALLSGLLRAGRQVKDLVVAERVAERAGGVLDLPGHALVALAAQADRPVDRCAFAHLLLPLGADLGQVIDPDVGGPAAVRTVHDEDLLIGQRHAGVRRRDARVVPLRDLCEKDIGDNVGYDAQFGAAWQVVGGHHGAEHGRNVQELGRRLLQLLVGHRTVGGAEVHRAGGDLLDPAAAADRLVVEPHLGIDLRVFVEPLGVDRVRKRRPRAVDQRLRPGRRGERARHEQRQRRDPRRLHRSPPLVQSGLMVAGRCFVAVMDALRLCYAALGSRNR